MRWSGILRVVGAAPRRMERAAGRRQRELEQQLERSDHMSERQRAALEVELYENYIELLRSVHQECSAPWDWTAVRDTPEPTPPALSTRRTLAAKVALDTYRPAYLDRLVGEDDEKRQELRDAIQVAEQADRAEYEQRLQEYELQHAGWVWSRPIAERVLSRDRTAYPEVIEAADPFSELGELGSAVEVEIGDRDPVQAVVHVNGDEVLPKEVKSLTRKGTLSFTKMPRERFLEIYREYVCGCALRVARELFALLPVDAVVVTAVSDLLSTSTGDMVQQPILSVAIPRRTLEGLNFETLDPCDSLRSLTHRMNFTKSKGFTPVERLRPEEVAL